MPAEEEIMNRSYDHMIFCDFDGTITTEETFVESLMRICGRENLEEWFGKFQRREITLRVCTETLFSLVPSEKYALLEEYAKTIQVRPGFSAFLDTAASLDIPVVVISGGIRRMQEEILRPYSAKILELYSCELDTSGPMMVFRSPYASTEENMSKETVMGLYSYKRAICIGDSVTDNRMAEHSDVVFARDMLAADLRKQGRPFYEWASFDDIAGMLQKVL